MQTWNLVWFCYAFFDFLRRSASSCSNFNRVSSRFFLALVPIMGLFRAMLPVRVFLKPGEEGEVRGRRYEILACCGVFTGVFWGIDGFEAGFSDEVEGSNSSLPKLRERRLTEVWLGVFSWLDCAESDRDRDDDMDTDRSNGDEGFRAEWKRACKSRIFWYSKNKL